MTTISASRNFIKRETVEEGLLKCLSEKCLDSLSPIHFLLKNYKVHSALENSFKDLMRLHEEDVILEYSKRQLNEKEDHAKT